MRCRASDAKLAETTPRHSSAYEQVFQFHVIDFMTALLQLQHQDESRVLVDVDRCNGVHNNRNPQNLHKLIRLLIPNHPRARQEIVPSPLFTAPNNPKET